MISRSRSAPTAAAMSIERTTSANKTVTCLYSAGGVPAETAAPHSLQNLAVSFSSVPHDPHDSPVAVISRRPTDRGSHQYRVTADQTCLSYRPRDPVYRPRDPVRRKARCNPQLSSRVYPTSPHPGAAPSRARGYWVHAGG